MKKYKINILLRIGATALLLYILLNKINFSLIFESLKAVSFLTILEILVIYFISMILLALKWRIMIQGTNLWNVIRYNFIGIYYSFILPGQVTGDAIKSYKLGTRINKVEKTIASALIDKITGLASLISISIFGLLFSDIPWKFNLLIIFIIVFILILTILIIVRVPFFQKFIFWILGILKRKFNRLEKLTSPIENFILEWINYSKKFRKLFFSFLLGLSFHSLAVMIDVLLASDFSIGVYWYDWCWIYGVMSVLLLIPLTIAGIGLRDGSLVTMLGLFAVTKETALAFAFCALGFLILFAVIGFLLDITLNNSKKQPDESYN